MFEVGTQRFRRVFKCDTDAINYAKELISQGIKVYVRDTYENVIIFGNYWR